LRVATMVEHVGGASARLRQVVTEDEATVAVLTVGLVCVGLGDGRPARIPERWRRVLTAWLGEVDRGSGG